MASPTLNDRADARALPWGSLTFDCRHRFACTAGAADGEYVRVNSPLLSPDRPSWPCEVPTMLRSLQEDVCDNDEFK
jgi:hypothetical protein